MRTITRTLFATLFTLVFALVPLSANAETATNSPSGPEVSISEVNLDGPAISPVNVTVTNESEKTMSKVSVTFSGPINWTVYPNNRDIKSVKPGKSAGVAFDIRVPEKRQGFTIRSFTATVSYKGGDGAGTASSQRTQKSGVPLSSLAEAYNNVGTTTASDPTAGNFDGYGNTFSDEQLALIGVTPGSAVSALGADFTWPDVEPGAENNAAGGAETIKFEGQGSTLAFLGSGSSLGASSGVTVWYADGTSSTGSVGFPNWSFQDADAYGATLVFATDGRNTPSGYANAGVDYRVFANSITIDPSKSVEMVTLPSNGSVHIFDMEIVE